MSASTTRSTNQGGQRAAVIGAGPNGLAAAIVLAQAGLQVEVFEAEPQPGGAARTLPLTLPGFLHDFGSAVHPMAAGSPFFSSLPLRDYGLEWIHSPAPLAHPLDDGTAVMLERDLRDAEAALGEDGKQWRRLMAPFAERWEELAPESPASGAFVHPASVSAGASGIARISFRGSAVATLVSQSANQGALRWAGGAFDSRAG